MEVSVTCVNLLLVFLLATHASSQQELNSTLHSTIYGTPVAYVDEMVTFTCVVRGSNSMAWTSDEYIGGQLELSAAEQVGTTQRAVRNPQTVAELIAVNSDIIVSRLNITIQSTFPTASVQCHNINAGTNTSVEFLLEDTTSIVCDKQSVCPGETVTCTCTTGNSNTLTWTNNGNSLTFASTDSLGTRRDLTGLSTYAVLADTSDTNGIRVITSNLSFVASSFGSSVVLTCANVDLSTSESVIIPVSDQSSVTTTVESCRSGDPSSSVTTPAAASSFVDTCARVIAAAVLVPAIVGLVIVIVIATGWGCHCIRYNKKIRGLETENKKLDDDVTRLTTTIQEKDRELSNKEKQLNNKREELRAKENEVRDKDRELQTIRRQLTESKNEAERKISQLNRELRIAKASKQS